MRNYVRPTKGGRGFVMLAPEMDRVRRSDRFFSAAISAGAWFVLFVLPPRSDWVETASADELMRGRLLVVAVALAFSVGFAVAASRIAAGIDRPTKSSRDLGLSTETVRVRSAASALYMSFAFPAFMGVLWRPGVGWLFAAIMLGIGTLVCTGESRWKMWADRTASQPDI